MPSIHTKFFSNYDKLSWFCTGPVATSKEPGYMIVRFITKKSKQFVEIETQIGSFIWIIEIPFNPQWTGQHPVFWLTQAEMDKKLNSGQWLMKDTLNWFRDWFSKFSHFSNKEFDELESLGELNFRITVQWSHENNKFKTFFTQLNRCTEEDPDHACEDASNHTSVNDVKEKEVACECPEEVASDKKEDASDTEDARDKEEDASDTEEYFPEHVSKTHSDFEEAVIEEDENEKSTQQLILLQKQIQELQNQVHMLMKKSEESSDAAERAWAGTPIPQSDNKSSVPINVEPECFCWADECA